jgi:predicted acylesterase/phospholipase RssA
VQPPVLVLSGGNALGAYHAGASDALEATGVEPGLVVGASIGAVTAAILAGKPRESGPGACGDSGLPRSIRPPRCRPP